MQVPHSYKHVPLTVLAWVFFFRVVLVSGMCAGLFGLCSGFVVSFVCSGYEVVLVFRLLFQVLSV